MQFVAQYLDFSRCFFAKASGMLDVWDGDSIVLDGDAGRALGRWMRSRRQVLCPNMGPPQAIQLLLFALLKMVLHRAYLKEHNDSR